MEFFIENEQRYLLITNMKVMYSTLRQQQHLTHLQRNAAVINRHLDMPLKKYFLVRNPYERAVSCYFDKFVINPTVPSFSLQHCQKMALPYINLDEQSSREDICRGLTNTSFPEYISLLKHVWCKDYHYTPQHLCRLDDALRERVKEMIRCAPELTVLKQEEQLPFLEKQLGINISIHRNKTPHEAYHHYFDSSLYQVMNDIYDKDFVYFGYEKHF